MRTRHFGASSWDDEDEEDEELDLSGFVTSNPPPPPVVERKRGASGIGNAGPRTQPAPEQEPAQIFGRRNSNLGYIPEPVMAGNPWNPLYAHDEALGSPKIWVVSKTAGAGLAMAGYSLSIYKGARPVTLPMAVIATGMYLHPVLGFRHGVLADKLADKHVIMKGLGYVGTQVAGFLVLRAAYRKSRGKSLREAFRVN